MIEKKDFVLSKTEEALLEKVDAKIVLHWMMKHGKSIKRKPSSTGKYDIQVMFNDLKQYGRTLDGCLFNLAVYVRTTDTWDTPKTSTPGLSVQDILKEVK